MHLWSCYLELGCRRKPLSLQGCRSMPLCKPILVFEVYAGSQIGSNLSLQGLHQLQSAFLVTSVSPCPVIFAADRGLCHTWVEPIPRGVAPCRCGVHVGLVLWMTEIGHTLMLHDA